jgi:hypothetical protein
LAQPGSGLIAAALMAAFPFLILFSSMGRGYTLLMLLTLILSFLVLRYVDHPSRKLGFSAAITGALGMLTMPTMLYPLSGLFLFMLVSAMTGRNIVPHAPAGTTNQDIPYQPPLETGRAGGDVHSSSKGFGVTHLVCVSVGWVILTPILYLPVIAMSGISPIAHNRFIVPLSWSELPARLADHLIDTTASLTRDIPISMILFMAVLTPLGITLLLRGKHRFLTLLVSMLLGSFAVLMATHTIPIDRTWIFVLPFWFIFLDYSICSLLKKSSVLTKNLLFCLMSLMLAIFSLSYICSDTNLKYEDTGTFPEAAAVADLLRPCLWNTTRIHARSPLFSPLAYYLKEGAKPDNSSSQHSDCAPRELFVVQTSRYSLADLTDANATLLLRYKDIQVYGIFPEPPSP